MNSAALDLLTDSFTGRSLIEASAGTGKTWTIATLYLRLLLERGLSPRQIVVATFTDAAGESRQELRAEGRVRHTHDEDLVKREANRQVQTEYAANVVAEARSEAIALQMRENGRRMLLLTHRACGGKGGPASLRARISESEK